MARTSETDVSPRVLGRQLLIELFECDRERLDNVSGVRDALLEAARDAEATIVEDVFHRFSPHGVSGVVVIAESHVAVHTWPEHGYAAVDVFTCSEIFDPYRVMASLQSAFRAGNSESRLVERGFRARPPGLRDTG